MISVKDLDEQLRFKIGDPGGSGDGQVFQESLRIGYIERGYARLIRSIRMVMRDYSPLFAISLDVIEKTFDEQIEGSDIELIDSSGNVIINKGDECFIYYKKGNIDSTETPKIKEVSYIEPRQYLSIKNGLNDMYVPSFDKEKFYYTFLNNLLYLLPLSDSTYSYTKISISVKKDVPKINKDSLLPIPNEYRDILLNMSAVEAMHDLERPNKAALYNKAVETELVIMKGYADIEERNEGRS